ncbi:MAG: type I methionyl aminopeptidase [Gammaproteobacteria bacterium]|nr:type I methionyl aminopeptidase [Gammaproteobacteria bacterium]
MTITIKNAEEIEKMRAAGRAAASLLEMIGSHIKPGVTTNALDEICAQYTLETLGATSAPLNYHGFPKSICTSVNHVVCHGIPDDKPLKSGDVINIDVTPLKAGYHGDSSCMFIVGEGSIQARRLSRVAYESMVRGIRMVRAGARLGDVGHAIQTYAEQHDYAIVREYCGHGIGVGFHEDPQVLHYGSPGTGTLLQSGMTITIEPMLNVGSRHVKVLGDGWTVVTKDRSLSAQWEHTVLVTDEGFEVLTLRNGESI